MGKRENFSRTTANIIAQRAGYRCAHPVCDGRTTVGPGKTPNVSENTGHACHIFAAAKRGPRGQGGLSSEELKSVSNGIWLCAKHSTQIDKNSGRDYPSPVLLGWKAAHEHRIAQEHGAMLNPYGWIESIRIVEAPVFKPNQTLSLANLNVIVGSNGAGKTALCEWLGSLGAITPLQRWGAYSKCSARLEYAIEFRMPVAKSLSVKIENGKVDFQLDDQNYPYSPVGYQVVYCNRNRRQFSGKSDDRNQLAKALSIDAIEVDALVEYLSSCHGELLVGGSWEEDSEATDDEASDRLICDLKDATRQAFCTMSGGEQSAVLLDLAIARARISATYRPTLLIIEMCELNISTERMQNYMQVLSAPDTPFQTVMTATNRISPDILWGGWQTIFLERSSGTSRSETEIAYVLGL